MKLSLEKIHLDLKVNWKLSRNSTNFKENFIVKLETSFGDFLSEIAPNVRYHETPEKIQAEFNEWMSCHDLVEIKDLESLKHALDKKQLLHALRFGLESVFLKYFANSHGTSLSQFLNIPLGEKYLKTSYSLPIMEIGEIRDYLSHLHRFEFLKVKVNAQTAVATLAEIKKYSRAKLRIDGNEAWKDFDEFIHFQESLKGMNIELIEQPFPSSMQDEYKKLKKQTPYTILADESIEDVGDFHSLSQQFHAINVKLMKTGSLLKARDLILMAKSHHMNVMMGCMIETTIGISYGMLFGGLVDYIDLDGFLLIKDEPFQLVSEREGSLSLN